MDTGTLERSLLTDEIAVVKPWKFLPAVVLMSIYSIAKTLSDTVIVNLMEKRACIVILNYDDLNCSEPVSPTIEGKIQQSAADLLLARTMIEGFLPALLTLFIGPWSDTNGRRPLILTSIAGSTLSAATWCVLSAIPGLHPMYFLLSSVPVALSGASPSLFLALFCYVSETSESDRRAVRMGLLMAGCLGGVLLSSLVSPYLLQISVKNGYTIVFATSALILLSTFVSTYYHLPESVKVVQSERTRLWRLEHVKGIFSTCFKPRTNHIRAIALCIIFTMAIFILCMEGDLSVLYMITQKKFNWSLIDYTRLTSFTLILAGMSVIFSTWFFSSLLKLPDLHIMFLGTLCMMSKSVVQALATSGTFLYAGSCFSVVSILISPLSRSQLSKLIPAEDLGKIFAFTTFVETSAPLAASPLYTFVYKRTLDSVPTTVFWMSAGFGFIAVLLIGTATVLNLISSPIDFRHLQEENDEDRTPTEQQHE